MSAIVFKPDFVPHISGLNIGLTVMALLALAFFLARKLKPRARPLATCQLIDKMHLSHKTTLYVIAVQNQRFVLADNQLALALHALDSKNTDAPL